jgi:hypothetical protein
MVKQPIIKMESIVFGDVCDEADLSEESMTDWAIMLSSVTKWYDWFLL